MCGIAGLFRPAGAFDPGAAERDLRAASGLMRRRGPDAEGLRVLPGHGLAFAHRRLAILDLDRRADQPMASADGRRLLVFNGEIYNFRELRAELAADGERFSTESDSEVLLAGSARWGVPGFLRRAAGMFAFALYDAEGRRLWLARDRAGKKPLFYSEEGGTLAFASELKALQPLRPKAAALDPAGLDAYLSLKFVPEGGTLVAGARKLPAGCLLAADASGVRVSRWWDPHAANPEVPRSAEEARARVDAALETAVRRRLVSDVPVCLFLSGGVDSSLLASRLARAGARLTAYSIGYRDLPAYNEFDYSRMTADRFGLRKEEILLDSKDALASLEDPELELDEPVADWVWLPLHQLCRRASSDGFKVALVGEGADELFFGYDVMLDGLRRLMRFSSPAARAAASVGSRLLAPIYRRVARGHRRYDLLRRAGAGEPVYMGSSVGFDLSQRHQVAGPALAAAGDPRGGIAFLESLYGRYRESAPRPDDLANLVCFVEFHAKMSEILLARVDRVSMLSSLEARAPFLDHELVELAFAIPGAMKAPDGRLKGLLKDLALRELPEPVVSRRKMGFSFPFKEWLRGELGAVVESAFSRSRLFSEGWLDGRFCRRLLSEHRRGFADHAPRLWMLYALCRWHDRWIARG